MNLIKAFILTLTLATLAQATPTGEELTKTKCASCHFLGVPTPQQIQSFKAPAMEAVLFHVKPAFKDNKIKIKEFMMDYVQNPDIKKSVCESNKVTKFGVMPSQKEVVSKEELSKIIDYLMDKYPTKEFVSLIGKMKSNGKMNSLKNSPFLMNQDNLPHLTKILIENWEKGALNLTSEQKKRLLVVREETMRNVKKIKIELKTLEAEIVEMLVDEEELKAIEPKVKKVANLKEKATMVHLKCLKESIEILNEKQLEYLLPFWGV